MQELLRSEQAWSQDTLPINILARATFPETPCWIWTGARQSKGYGSISVGGKTHLVHRYIYELMIGPIPNRLTLDHRCNNKVCFNPDHLRVMTRLANQIKYYSNITHCPKDHEYTPENTKRNRNGTRSCRACSNASRRAARIAEKIQ